MTFQPQLRDIDLDIELQHLDEAEFMFQVWDAALEAPNYALPEIVAGPERRLLAHVDALALGESVVVEHILVPTIEDRHADYERVAAAVLASSRPTHAVGVLVDATELDQRRGIIRALESWQDPQLDGALIGAFAPTPVSFRRDALVWVALLGDATAQHRVLGLIDLEGAKDDALWAAGFTGRVLVVDRCVELLADDQLGPLAAEAICAITGLATDDDRFWRTPAPRDMEAEALPELEDDDLSADLVPGPEAALPQPEPDAIAGWWRENRDRFDPTLRYLGGKPITMEVMIDALWNAPARRRHNLALELALRTGGAAAIDTRMLSAKQRTQLERLSSLGPIDLQRGSPLR